MTLDKRFSRSIAYQIGALALSAISWPVRVAAARRLMSQMTSMNDHELADIGLHRQDLRDIAALGLTQDPTEVLAPRAAERRGGARRPARPPERGSSPRRGEGRAPYPPSTAPGGRSNLLVT